MAAKKKKKTKKKKAPASASAPSSASFFATPAEFRAWMVLHHQKATELWVGFYHKKSGKPSITWPESVEVALCFGWIDGRRQNIGADAYRIRFTPRKPGSNWSRINVESVARLEQARLMTDAGRAAFAQLKPDKSGVYSFEQDRPVEIAPKYRDQLKANAKAWAYFQSRPPWYRRSCAHWIMGAKKEETQQRRLDQLVACSAAGKSVPPLTRPGE